MCLDLRLAAALCHENGKGQQFPLRDGQELTGIEVTKAVCEKIVLNVLLIFQRGGTHGVDMLPENGFLCGDAIRQSAFLRDGLTARPRQGNAFFRQYLIDSVHSIFSFAKTDIGRAMVSAAFSVLFIMIPPDPSTTLFHLSRFNSPDGSSTAAFAHVEPMSIPIHPDSTGVTAPPHHGRITRSACICFSVITYIFVTAPTCSLSVRP